ncbi:hypothetical protein HQ489_05720 [Candidatus Woesearchaeota archaeon]|nr:hypothetical protein [Candidatus Woesearchaeota archaeon]
MTLNALLFRKETLDDQLQKHLVEGKKYARLGVFRGINSSLLDEGDICFYNFQKTSGDLILGYQAKQILRTHHLILYN